MSKLERWRVCKEETAMAGAAAALLSISDLGLILDSPMWCSALTSRRIAECEPLWASRMYSTLIEENDLVFGAKKKLLQAAQDMRQEADYAVMGIAVNCGPALMGDDIEGICQSVMDIPVCVSDASGFNGDADRGWSDAMISLLRKVPHFSEKKQAGKINVIGQCILDPASDESWEKVLFVPGCQPMKYEELARLSEAEMNLVVHPRGLAVARWLQEHAHVPYSIQYESSLCPMLGKR